MMQDMAEVVGPKMVNQLSAKCLKSLILQESNGSKEKARENILQLHEFREQLKEISKLQFRNFIYQEFNSIFSRFCDGRGT
jgi:hypothetical protein